MTSKIRLIQRSIGDAPTSGSENSSALAASPPFSAS
jgi:hypothetical protein